MQQILYKQHSCSQPGLQAAQACPDIGFWGMRELALAFLLVMAAAGLCRAEQNYAYPVFVSAPDTSVKVQTLTGSIDSVSVADSSKGLPSELILEGHNGRQVLIVKATTTIYDAAWRPTSLDGLKKKDRVKVKYFTTGEGFSEALSIKQLQ